MELTARSKFIAVLVSLTAFLGVAVWLDRSAYNGTTAFFMRRGFRYEDRGLILYSPLGMRSSSAGTKTAAADVGKSMSAHKNHVWCPTSICRNSDLCHPCHRRFLIVLATGRSASTTLTWMLDSLPGVRMAGENADELKVLKSAIDNVQVNEHWESDEARKGPWGHNPTPDGAFACVVQKMIETIAPPLNNEGKNLYDDSREIVGFKTVRFLAGVSEEETAAMASWLLEMFPCARFIVNIRTNVDDQAKSWKKAFGSKADANMVDMATRAFQLNQQMLTLAAKLGKAAYVLDSSDWVENVSDLNAAVSWLGFSKSCHFTELLEFNTKYNGYGNGNVEAHPDADCHYEG